MDIQAFWRDVLAQNRPALPAYFREGAVVRWPCTDEQFTAEEYIRANCDYPGDWTGEIERVEVMGPVIALAGRVYPAGGGPSHHVVSFLRLEGDRIAEMDEYWAEDSDPPAWRAAMGIGRPIRRREG